MSVAILLIIVIVAAHKRDLFKLGAIGFLKREYNLDKATFADLLEQEIVSNSWRRNSPEIWSISFLIDHGRRLGIKDDDLQSKLEFYKSEYRKQFFKNLLFNVLGIIFIIFALLELSRRN